MINVYDKEGILHEAVDAGSVESFVAKQQKERKGRVAIGVESNDGICYIVRSSADMMELDHGDIKGDLLLMIPYRGMIELWKCI